MRSPVSRVWVWILISAVAVTVALFIGLQVFGVLAGLVNVPMPPLPQSAVQMEHTSETYGVDRWAYQVAVFPSDVTQYYQAQTANCETAPFDEPRMRELWDEFVDASTLMAYCEGERSFSGFSMRWRALVSTTDPLSGSTRVDLVRIVNWFGPTPDG